MSYLKELGCIGAIFMLGLFAIASDLSAQSPPYGGYANSPYTTGTGASDYMDDVIIKLGSTTLLSNVGTGATSSPYNIFYGSIAPANLVPGQVHQIQVKVCPTYSEYITVYIDYNNDGDFIDSGETVCYSANIPAGTTGSMNFTPSTTASGICRMRVRCVWNTSGPHSPTTSYTYGECEDYLVNLGFTISTGNPLPAAAQNGSYNTTIVAVNGATPYTWNTSISGLPPGITAAQSGDDLVLSGTPTTVGNYSFTVSVTDNASDNAQKMFNLAVVPPPAAMPFLDDFSAATGWQLGNTWTIGAATTYAPTGSPPRSEPGTDATPSSSDNMILGDNIGGDYAANQGGAYYAVSPMVNCTTATTVRVRFWRWLGCSIGSTASIEVSNNGTTWTSVWSSTSGTSQTTIRDTVWTPVFYDITAVAAGNATVQVRFGMGPTSSTIHTGWCIDDFQIEEPGPDLEVREGGAGGTIITDNQAVGGLRDFGLVSVSTQSTPLTIAMTNLGPTPIDVSGGIQKTGANPGDFTVQAGGFPASIAVGQTATFTVIYYRTTAGVSTATLNIAHNASGSGTTPFEINLTAEAVVPIPNFEVRLGLASGPIIPHQDPAVGTVRDFGNQDISAGPTGAITLTIVNSGTGALGLATPDMDGAWWTEYVVSAPSFPSSLAPGASASFTVAFDPSSIGPKNALIRIVHTDTAKSSPYYVPVTGEGTSPGPTVKTSDGATVGPAFPYDAPAAGARDFGIQLLSAGATPARTFSIDNTGSGTLTIGTPVLGGPNAGDFVLNTTGMATSLPSNTSTSFTVAFDPTAIGQRDATITFTHNDAGVTSPYIINIKGEGTNTAGIVSVRETDAAGAVLTNPATATGILDFGTWGVSSGATLAATIYVENTGTSALQLGTPAFNPATTEFQIQSAGFAGSLAIGASATFTITFDPTTIAVHIATIEFTHDSPSTANPFVINVTGEGILNAPLVEVHEDSLFGPAVASGDAAVSGGGRDLGSMNVTAGASAPITLFISNAGTLNMNLGAAALAGPNASSFALNLSGYTSVVTPGGSATIQVTFNPSLGGLKDAYIEFIHDDTTQPNPFVINLVGRAIDPTGVQITTTTLPAGLTGAAYGPTTITASQGSAPYTWSIYSGTLPTGVTLSPAGVLSGTPTGYGGEYRFTVRVTDLTGATNEKPYAVTIVGDLGGRATGGSSCAAQDGPSFGLLMLALLAALGAGARFHTRRRA